MATERGAKLTAQIAIGERLRRVRLQQGLEQREVAARLGMSESNFSRYENGWNALAATQIEAFAAALNVTPKQLIETLFSDLLISKDAEPLHFRPEHPARTVGRVLVGAGA
jgi:transcriptional regulator with XRE-family HTH domain